MSASKYKVVLVYDEAEKVYNVSVPSLPGCFTFGASRAEALEKVTEAIEGYLEVLLEDGDPIPSGNAELAEVAVIYG